jgi:predicted phosphoribosyltransferase
MPALKDRVVVVVDDGVATGATFHATLQTIRRQEPKLLVGAAPVGPIDSTSMLAASADVFVCPHRPRWFRAVGEWYDRFGQVSEEEVIAALS